MAIGYDYLFRMGLLLYYGGHGHSHGGVAHSHSHDVAETLPISLNSAVEQTARPSGGHDVNINVRAAFIHVLGDMIQSVGVLIASLVILWNVSSFKSPIIL